MACAHEESVQVKFALWFSHGVSPWIEYEGLGSSVDAEGFEQFAPPQR